MSISEIKAPIPREGGDVTTSRAADLQVGRGRWFGEGGWQPAQKVTGRGGVRFRGFRERLRQGSQVEPPLAELVAHGRDAPGAGRFGSLRIVAQFGRVAALPHRDVPNPPPTALLPDSFRDRVPPPRVPLEHGPSETRDINLTERSFIHKQGKSIIRRDSPRQQ